MRYWINLIGVPYDDLAPIAREAERLGFYGLALADHMAVPTSIESPYPGGVRPWDHTDDWPDVWVTIGALAALTTRLRFVSNVYVLPMRHPLVVAKAVGTAAVISSGRVVFGAGIGWMAEEFAAAGASFRTRGRRADEMLQILRRGWDDGRVAFDGDHYRFAEVNLLPQPSSYVPIWIGGHSDAAIERAAHFGDGWISGRPLGGAEPLVARLRDRRAELGRAGTPFTIAVSLYTEPSAEIVAQHEAAGVVDVKVEPWAGGHRAPLEVKLDAIARFASRHIG